MIMAGDGCGHNSKRSIPMQVDALSSKMTELIYSFPGKEPRQTPPHVILARSTTTLAASSVLPRSATSAVYDARTT